MFADLYEHFLFSLGDDSYYPPGVPHVSDNRLFTMYHANTPSHNEEVIFDRMQKPDGVVRVVFARVALGMEINFAPLSPASIKDYMQESGHVAQSGDQAKSVMLWKPSDAPDYKYTSKYHR